MSRELGKAFQGPHHPNVEAHRDHEHQVVRWTHNKKHYELLANVGEVESYRNGTKPDIDSVLYTRTIYYNHLRDEKPTEDELAAHLPDMTYDQIVDTILRKGDVQISVSERTHKATAKKTELIEYIHNNYIDSGSKASVPVGVIGDWLEKVHHKFHTGGENINKSVEDLANEAVSAILQVGGAAAPKLHKAHVQVEVYVPVDMSGKAEGEVRRFGSIVSERDEIDRYFFTVELLPGHVEELIARLNVLTKGNTGVTLKSVDNEEVVEPIVGSSINAAKATASDAKHGGKQAKKDSELKKTNRALKGVVDNMTDENFASEETA